MQIYCITYYVMKKKYKEFCYILGVSWLSDMRIKPECLPSHVYVIVDFLLLIITFASLVKHQSTDDVQPGSKDVQYRSAWFLQLPLDLNSIFLIMWILGIVIMVQLTEFLQPLWETWIELLVPSFSLAQPWLLQGTGGVNQQIQSLHPTAFPFFYLSPFFSPSLPLFLFFSISNKCKQNSNSKKSNNLSNSRNLLSVIHIQIISPS